MNKKCGIIISVFASACAAVNLAGFRMNAEAADTLVKTELNYTEQTGYDLGYSDCGYSSASWINAKPGKDWTVNPTTFTLLLIDIGGYSSAMNEDGKDYDLDKAFFDSLEGTLKNARANGVTVGIRLRYDSNGTNNPEPGTFQKVLDHIEQVGKSGLLYEYEDVITYVETGMVGAWGEQWGGKYVSLSYKAQVLDAFLNIVPKSISVSVRTPNTFREWLSTYCGVETTAADMSYSISDPELAEKAAQVGLYNDGYMGSDSDLGTYSNRKGETLWLSGAAAYGGEFSGSDEFRIGYDTWQPQNALPEMYLTKLMRINGNIYRTKEASKTYSTEAEAQERLSEIGELYKKMGLESFDYEGKVTAESDGKYKASWKWMGYDAFTFDKSLDGLMGTECDNSAFYGKDVFQYMRAHLGYRYVLRSSAMNVSAEPGGNLDMEFSVDNTGFAQAPKDKEVEVLLSDGNTVYTYTTDINAKNWKSGKTSEEKLHLNLPETMSGGDWNVYLRISAENDDAKYDAAFCNKFANEELNYSEKLGANYMGSIKVSGEKAPVKEKNENKRPSGFYPESAESYAIDNSGKISLLDRTYTFEESGHYGFTLLYKVDGITDPIQLGKWHLSFSNGSTGYSSAYTTYGLNTMNLEISENGYYALSIPFYGAVFNFDKASEAGETKLTGLSINDPKNYWSDKTFTQINGSEEARITPIGFVEGAPEGYSVTYHLESGDVTYKGDYGFTDVKRQNISNVPAVTALSLLDKECPESYTDGDGKVYSLLGFTTRKDDKSCIISEDFTAIGDIELYPLYELDKNKTDFNGTAQRLTNDTDDQGIKYILNDSNMTASVGDGSVWENNSSYSGSGSIVIPAYVESAGKRYMVTEISENAFGSNLNVTDAVIPGTVSAVGENAFYKGTVLYVYENSSADKLLKNSEYTVNVIKTSGVRGDVNRDGSVDKADEKLMRETLINGNMENIVFVNSDMDANGILNVYDFIMIKRMIVI